MKYLLITFLCIHYTAFTINRGDNGSAVMLDAVVGLNWYMWFSLCHMASFCPCDAPKIMGKFFNTVCIFTFQKVMNCQKYEHLGQNVLYNEGQELFYQITDFSNARVLFRNKKSWWSLILIMALKHWDMLSMVLNTLLRIVTAFQV